MGLFERVGVCGPPFTYAPRLMTGVFLGRGEQVAPGQCDLPEESWYPATIPYSVRLRRSTEYPLGIGR